MEKGAENGGKKDNYPSQRHCISKAGERGMSVERVGNNKEARLNGRGRTC